MGNLTVLQVKNIKPAAKTQMVADGDGLNLKISPAGTKSWVVRYRHQGRQKNYALGTFPDMSLAAARDELRSVKELIQQGLDPVEHRRLQKRDNALQQKMQRFSGSNTFDAVCREWHDIKRHGWSADHASDVLGSLDRHVLPYIGDVPVGMLKPPEVLLVLRRIEAQGSHELARKILQRINAVCRYAIQTGRATYNPAADMQGALQGAPKGSRKNQHHFPLASMPDYLHSLDQAKIHIITRSAMRFLILTASRTKEVRLARWNQIDLASGTWTMAITKNGNPHTQYLSRQAIAILERMQLFARGKKSLVFPGIRKPSEPLSDNTLLVACIYRLGWKGKASVHGFRHIFSTAANETGRFHPDIIERQLAHGDDDRIRAVYNKAEYANQRREMMQWWADLLDGMVYDK